MCVFYQFTLTVPTSLRRKTTVNRHAAAAARQDEKRRQKHFRHRKRTVSITPHYCSIQLITRDRIGKIKVEELC